jgi:hypothetical protein
MSQANCTGTLEPVREHLHVVGTLVVVFLLRYFYCFLGLGLRRESTWVSAIHGRKLDRKNESAPPNLHDREAGLHSCLG